jgi:hypothetical protein
MLIIVTMKQPNPDGSDNLRAISASKGYRIEEGVTLEITDKDGDIHGFPLVNVLEYEVRKLYAKKARPPREGRAFDFAKRQRPTWGPTSHSEDRSSPSPAGGP